MVQDAQPPQHSVESVVTNLWDIILQIHSGETCYGHDPGSPYATDSSSDHFYRYFDSTRTSTQRKHAMQHCCIMAEEAGRANHWPLAYDWMLAAAAVADSTEHVSDFLHFVLTFHGACFDTSYTSWADFLQHPPQKVDRRLLAVTLIRLIASHVPIPEPELHTFLAYIRSQLPDVSQSLGIHDSGMPTLDQVKACRQLPQRLRNSLDVVLAAGSAEDIHILCLQHHHVQRALNQQTVAAILSPFLPRSFVKTKVSMLFTLLRDLKDASTLKLPEISKSCVEFVDSALAELNDCGTFAARRYLLPLLHRTRFIVRRYYESSDATKPANVTVTPYKKKYPFGYAGASTRLRFIAHNVGPGPAAEVTFSFMFAANVAPFEATTYLSTLEKGSAILEIPVTVGDSCADPVEYLVEITWKNFDGSTQQAFDTSHLQHQRREVDWVSLRSEEPYSLTAISKGRTFIGRKADLGRLLRTVTSSDMGSAIVHGQKRVGKTSLAMELSRLANESTDCELLPIYLESGDYIEPTAGATVKRLGRTLCRRFRAFGAPLSRIDIPEFEDSLSPLAEFLDDVFEYDRKHSFLIILDEFDELPLELYKRGPIGSSFFLTLRTLSSRSRIGIVLVGAEKVAPILNAQGDKLNKWAMLHLDYFDKANHWADFQDLVTVPTKGRIEFSDDAVAKIYEWCSGNPYYCNVICREIIDACIDRKDSFVSELEVEEAARHAVQVTGANSFQHFWEDGILAPGTFVEEVSVRRRRVLLAFANALRRAKTPSSGVLVEDPLLAPLGPGGVDAEIKQFVERCVLQLQDDGVLQCRIKLFEEWLRERSPQQIALQYIDPNQQEREQQIEQQAYVTAGELVELARKWRVYRGQAIDAEYIRAWIDQFQTNQDQRLMYQLLGAVRFYSQDRIRDKLKEAMGIVKRATIERKLEHGKFRRDLIVVALGGPAKSGYKMSRLFAAENRIHSEGVVDLHGLQSKFESHRASTQAVVIVDDFVGTGDTARAQLSEVGAAVGEAVRAGEARLFYVAVCGFEGGRRTIEEKASQLSLPISVNLCDTMEDDHKAFAADSGIFLSDTQRFRARELAHEKGLLLEPRAPLGYGDCEALVVFDDSCPNNSLPILWKNGKEWQALFPRL